MLYERYARLPRAEHATAWRTDTTSARIDRHGNLCGRTRPKFSGTPQQRHHNPPPNDQFTTGIISVDRG